MGDGGAEFIDSSLMVMFGTDNIMLKKLNHAGLPKGHDNLRQHFLKKPGHKNKKALTIKR